MKPVGGDKIPWSANFSSTHWLDHPMNVKKPNFNFYIYTLFLDHFCVLIIQC